MDTTEQLIESLRSELQEYGEMLALLDRQQELIVRRAADEIINNVTAVHTHSEVLLGARERRNRSQRMLAEEMRLPKQATLSDLIRSLPAKYQPLVQALLQENSSLLFKLQQRARQNHVLLARSIELMNELIRSLLPVTPATVYNKGGVLGAPVFTGRTQFEAVG